MLRHSSFPPLLEITRLVLWRWIISQASFGPIFPQPHQCSISSSRVERITMYLVKSAILLAQGWNVTVVTRHAIMCTHVVEDTSN